MLPLFSKKCSGDEIEAQLATDIDLAFVVKSRYDVASIFARSELQGTE